MVVDEQNAFCEYVYAMRVDKYQAGEREYMKILTSGRR